MVPGLNIALIGGVAVLFVLYVLRRRSRLGTTALTSPSSDNTEASGQQEPTRHRR